jgi:hypothetical protein
VRACVCVRARVKDALEVRKARRRLRPPVLRATPRAE